MTHFHVFDEWVEEPGPDSRVLGWVLTCSQCGFSRDRLAWRVLVTGSRSLTNRKLVDDALEDEYRHAEYLGVPMVVVEGQCPYGGADRFAEEWAIFSQAVGRYVEHDPITANWQDLGKIAGSIRNQYMVDLGADKCLGFPTEGSRGTWDCLRRAEDAGIPTRVVE